MGGGRSGDGWARMATCDQVSGCLERLTRPPPRPRHKLALPFRRVENEGGGHRAERTVRSEAAGSDVVGTGRQFLRLCVPRFDFHSDAVSACSRLVCWRCSVESRRGDLQLGSSSLGAVVKDQQGKTPRPDPIKNASAMNLIRQIE